MNKIKEIVDKYDFELKEGVKYSNKKLYENIKNQWQSYISKGHYGFDIGPNLPESWYNCINEVLNYLDKMVMPGEEMNSLLFIQQIKIKFGGLRFYVTGKISSEDWEGIHYMESKMRSKELIY